MRRQAKSGSQGKKQSTGASAETTHSSELSGKDFKKAIITVP